MAYDNDETESIMYFLSGGQVLIKEEFKRNLAGSGLNPGVYEVGMVSVKNYEVPNTITGTNIPRHTVPTYI